MPVAETTFTGWLMSKGLLGLGGAFGALAMASMYIPKKLQEKFPRTSAAVAAGLGVLLALSAGSILIIYMGWNANIPEVNFSTGVLSGVLATVIIAWIANTMIKTEGKDLFEVVEIIKKQQITEKKPVAKPVRRVRAGTKK